MNLCCPILKRLSVRVMPSPNRDRCRISSLRCWRFCTVSRRALDAVILEVGLGGRLDAVNIMDTDCAIISSIDLDHIEFLGDTREKIGFEKAGIFRPGKPAICADPLPPRSLVEYAQRIGADLWLAG